MKPSQKPASSLAADEYWCWLLFDEDEENLTWRLQWRATPQASRHHRRIEDQSLSGLLFPFSPLRQEESFIDIAATPGRPLASVQWRDLSPLRIRNLFEGLGVRLRRLHDLPAPSGFGDPESAQRFQTINAYMAAHFTELSHHLPRLEQDDLHDRAVDLLADLRMELSIFHPHGKSCWTVGILSPERMLFDEDSGQIKAILDLGSTLLRPPEYDLAALRACGMLSDHPVADRAFWKGYRAALTRDLERRCAYFGRLIELEALLANAASIQSA